MELDVNEGITIDQLLASIRSNGENDLISVVDDNYTEISNPGAVLTNNMYLEVDRAGSKLYYSINVRLKLMSIDTTNTIINK